MDFSMLLAVDSADTLNFFHTQIVDLDIKAEVTRDERIYVASVLASFARTSRCDSESLPTFTSLTEIFDQFVSARTSINDPILLELAGAQDLLLAGFFRDQMSRRHNVKWYDALGQQFYRRASECSKNLRRSEMFSRVSTNFPVWAMACRDLNRSLMENQYNQYLLRL